MIINFCIRQEYQVLRAWKKAFKPTMHDLNIDIAKLYDQLVRGMSVVGDTTMQFTKVGMLIVDKIR